MSKFHRDTVIVARGDPCVLDHKTHPFISY